MPKYKVSFEYETEVEADNEEDAIFNCSTVICDYMGDNAIVEEIEEGKTWIDDDGHEFTVESNVVEVTDKEVEEFWDKKFTGDG